MNKELRRFCAIVLGVSVAVAVLGAIFLAFACHGECGSDVHGGMLTFVCQKFFFPKAGCILMTVTGGAFALFTGGFLLLNRKAAQIETSSGAE